MIDIDAFPSGGEGSERGWRARASGGRCRTPESACLEPHGRRSAVPPFPFAHPPPEESPASARLAVLASSGRCTRRCMGGACRRRRLPRPSPAPGALGNGRPVVPPDPHPIQPTSTPPHARHSPPPCQRLRALPQCRQPSRSPPPLPLPPPPPPPPATAAAACRSPRPPSRARTGSTRSAGAGRATRAIRRRTGALCPSLLHGRCLGGLTVVLSAVREQADQGQAAQLRR